MPSGSVLENVIREVRSGLVSSVVAEAILFPLDAVKLKQQVHGGSVAQVTRRILREQGACGLYQGITGRLIQSVTSNVGFFVWQTVLMQAALRRLPPSGLDRPPAQLSTARVLCLNMLAQQINRVLTTPVDVVANVNQTDPQSRGFFHTFVKLARTGGRAALWRGLPVTLLLALNPALMFTLVGKLAALVCALRGRSGSVMSAAEMFWISGASKAVATLLTYPLIRAKAVIQSAGADAPVSGLWSMLTSIAAKEGMGGLYRGVWILSYKTVLFNSLMMALKQKIELLLERRRRDASPRRAKELADCPLRQRVVVVRGGEPPWEAAERGARVAYADGSWCFLHEAQELFLREAARRADHLVVGIHSDEEHEAAVGARPPECFADRLARLREHPGVSSILVGAPWEVGEGLLRQLGAGRVLAGSVTKLEDCAPPPREGAEGPLAPSADPYLECKRLGLFEEVESRSRYTEHEAWLTRVTQVAFSNVDASIDWCMLVSDQDGEQPT